MVVRPACRMVRLQAVGTEQQRVFGEDMVHPVPGSTVVVEVRCTPPRSPAFAETKGQPYGIAGRLGPLRTVSKAAAKFEALHFLQVLEHLFGLFDRVEFFAFHQRQATAAAGLLRLEQHQVNACVSCLERLASHFRVGAPPCGLGRMGQLQCQMCLGQTIAHVVDRRPEHLQTRIQRAASLGNQRFQCLDMLAQPLWRCRRLLWMHQPSAAITSAGACTSSISTPSPAMGNSSLLLGCRKVMS